MVSCVSPVGAEEVRLSVVHEQTSWQKAQTLHRQPAGKLRRVGRGVSTETAASPPVCVLVDPEGRSGCSETSRQV